MTEYADDDLEFSIVVAATEGGVIGNHGRMPWRIPSDLRRFRDITTEIGVVVMGRKTYATILQTLGHPLQDRKSIVLSRKATGRTETLAFVSDFKGACQEARRLGGRAAIIGGGEIYRLFLPHALRVHMTTVYMDVSGDTTFPTLTGQWRCAEWESAARRDVRDEFLSSYQVYERVSVQH